MDDRNNEQQGDQSQHGIGQAGHARDDGAHGLDQGGAVGAGDRTDSGVRDAGGDDPARGGTGEDGSSGAAREQRQERQVDDLDDREQRRTGEGLEQDQQRDGEQGRAADED